MIVRLSVEARLQIRLRTNLREMAKKKNVVQVIDAWNEKG
jgi:hypothetical protein